MLRVFLALTIGCACTVLANGQTTAPGSDRAPSTWETEVEARYDSAKDQTAAGFRYMQLDAAAPDCVLLSIDVTYHSKKLKHHPEDLVVIFQAISPKGFKYPNAFALNITADGKHLPEVLILRFDQSTTAASYFLETLGTRMKYDIFMKMARAEKVEMLLGTVELHLTSAQLVKLSKLADMISPDK